MSRYNHERTSGILAIWESFSRISKSSHEIKKMGQRIIRICFDLHMIKLFLFFSHPAKMKKKKKKEKLKDFITGQRFHLAWSRFIWFADIS